SVEIRILHESFRDFLQDQTRSREFFVDKDVYGSALFYSRFVKLFNELMDHGQLVTEDFLVIQVIGHLIGVIFSPDDFGRKHIRTSRTSFSSGLRSYAQSFITILGTDGRVTYNRSLSLLQSGGQDNQRDSRQSSGVTANVPSEICSYRLVSSSESSG
ncbi:hypothetical protein MPER_01918, partial [Moniliophthora perniciosa FA553]